MTVSVTFRFYAELNDFLEPANRQADIVRSVARRTSVKDAIESMGVPHPEVDLLLVDGRPAGFGHRLAGGERVTAFPRFRKIELEDVSLVRPAKAEPRFVLDVHLGRLAAYLRLAGFDADYRNDATDPELAGRAEREARILLTRDVGLLQRGGVSHGYFVRETAPARQLLEVLRRFDLQDRIAAFTRCLRCNVPVVPATDPTLLERVPPRIREGHSEFRMCPACARIYWKGTHYEWMVRLLEGLRNEDEGRSADACRD